MIPLETLSEEELKEYIDPKTGKSRKWIPGKISLPLGWKVVGYEINIKPISSRLVGRGSTPVSRRIGVMKGICKNKLDPVKAAKFRRMECGGAVRVQPKTHDWVCTTCGLVTDYQDWELDSDSMLGRNDKTEEENPTKDKRLPQIKKKLQTDYIDRRVLVTAKEKLGRDLKATIYEQERIPPNLKTGIVKGLQPYLPDLDYHTINNSVNRIIKRYKSNLKDMRQKSLHTEGPQKPIEPPKPNPKKPRYEGWEKDYYEKQTSLEEIKNSVEIERQNSRKPPMETIFEGTTRISRQPSNYLDEMIACHFKMKSCMTLQGPQFSPCSTA
jgi:hypothetical protein